MAAAAASSGVFAGIPMAAVDLAPFFPFPFLFSFLFRSAPPLRRQPSIRRQGLDANGGGAPGGSPGRCMRLDLPGSSDFHRCRLVTESPPSLPSPFSAEPAVAAFDSDEAVVVANISAAVGRLLGELLR